MVGGLGIVPLCAVAPLVMYQLYNRGAVGTAQSVLNWALAGVLLCVSGAITFASVERIVDQAGTFKIFA